MTRLAWRQFRTEALVGLGALALVGVVLAVTGPHLVNLYGAYVQCRQTDCTGTANPAKTDLSLQYGLAALLLGAPALVGMFFGAPLIARELETGTFRLAWTQSVTRARWLVVKLALVGSSSAVLAGGLSLMAAWWANPIDNVRQARFAPAIFGLLGAVPFGYGLFAFTLGATAGTLFRKTIPAMATTIVGYVAARVAVTYGVRPYFEPPVTKRVPWGPSGLGGYVMSPSGLDVAAPQVTIPNGWVYSTSVVDQAGHVPTRAFINNACPGLISGPALRGPTSKEDGLGLIDPRQFQHCLTILEGKLHGLVTYQPASRYWPFQTYETVVFVVLALALAAVSWWWMHRRLS